MQLNTRCNKYIYNKGDTSIINVVFMLNKKSNYCLKEIDHKSILHIYPNNEVNKCLGEVMLLVLGQQNLWIYLSYS
jgi:hypothetical protein